MFTSSAPEAKKTGTEDTVTPKTDRKRGSEGAAEGGVNKKVKKTASQEAVVPKTDETSAGDDGEQRRVVKRGWRKKSLGDKEKSVAPEKDAKKASHNAGDGGAKKTRKA
ncbi:hypothetical protein BDK51DRAFT_31610 [Blyttiomyces helicus]|uniref:Uncharacterized protein n=1 Tax=Blyttiomyces helicus TaxID=388810 RepID=A0A4V1IR89_9FUNG|nr:hypothetical protein BDK51DRAFT_31610 [Blyttiomyces helicus]|eukprot:RKO89217.1 hypothetical protein BDK51DRAFT_31610 [Blyttiomyces helicus]